MSFQLILCESDNDQCFLKKLQFRGMADILQFFFCKNQ